MTHTTNTSAVTLTHFAALSWDHNDAALTATGLLTRDLSDRFEVAPTVVSGERPAQSTTWEADLVQMEFELASIGSWYSKLLDDRCLPVTVSTRGAIALATLPMIAHHRPDAVVVWLGAYASLNTPASAPASTLDHMALSGPLGHWHSGFGSGLSADCTILAGAREASAAERALIDGSDMIVVELGEGFAKNLQQAVGGRPVYVHLDCNVLDPNVMPATFPINGGVSLNDIHQAAEVLAKSELVGVEIAALATRHYEKDGRALIGALEPLLDAVDERARAMDLVEA